MRIAKSSRARDVNVLLHELEVRQAELELQNQELIASNDELRRSNGALAVARDRFRALYELAPAPLVTVDVAGQILDVNRAAEALLQVPRGAVTARPLSMWFAAGARAGLRAFLARLFDAGEAFGTESSVSRASGDVVDVRIDGVVFRDDDGADAVLSLVDLSARRRAEEERRAIERLVQDAQRLESLGVLAGGVAHDLNNLLTVILSGTDRALRGLGDSKLAEPLIEVRQAARHAGQLAQQMLAYSGLASAAMRPLDVGALVAEVRALIEAAAGTTPVAFELPPLGGWVCGDPTQLRQVVLNLVRNAGEAMSGRPGRIALSVVVDGDGVVIGVSDAGAGMGAATRARIFEPYYSTKFAGRGLGLAVVQGIVRAHKGTLTVDSEVGRGTTIRVRLPAVRPVTEAHRAETEEGSRGPGTVLLAEDELGVRRSIERILLELGYEVLVASDGLEALEIVRTDGDRIDVVLMDHVMPRMDGPTAAARIHEARPGMPIVLVTGFAQVPPPTEIAFADVLAKPFDLASLERLMERLVPPRASSSA